MGRVERVAAVRSLRVDLQSASDTELLERAQSLQREVQRLGSSIRVDETGRVEADMHAAALACESLRRFVGLDPFDVQVEAGLAMVEGAVIEMATGEGKTLAAVIPAVYAALGRTPTHVLTFNDYLASRDAAWMGPAYAGLGLSVGAVSSSADEDERRKCYRCDVTYVTARQAGFDFLRDQLVVNESDLVQGVPGDPRLGFALVDEADSLMIDEARVPMVIAGPAAARLADPTMVAAIVSALDDRDWQTDEGDRNVVLTEVGVERVEQRLSASLGKNVNLYDNEYLDLLTEVHQALHAHVLLHRGIDYLVDGERIVLVDEFTGRAVPDRRWPDGLQAALEAKEGLPASPPGIIRGSITMQHFLQQYTSLAGMTGTASSRSTVRELREMYGKTVVSIAPNRRNIRRDDLDLIFATDAVRDAAVVERVVQEQRRGRPVLVGTASVAESERLAGALRARAVKLNVLNAANDADEAKIVAEAGSIGAVTISTNMAGRGTDIRLGGSDSSDAGAVKALGGLLVIGTHRHESIRIDHQLRGRAGRQGDPGSSVFYVSLEDPLLRRLGISRLIPDKLIKPWGANPIEHRAVRREVARLQRIADGQLVEIRSTLVKYTSIVEQQRKLVAGRRAEALLHVDDTRRSAELREIDRLWIEHLAFVAHLREGIHLLGLGGLDPLFEFRKQVFAAFEDAWSKLDERVDRASDKGPGLDNGRGPASTWTYLLNDQAVSDLHRMLFAPGHVGFAAGAVVMVWPLLLLWGLWRRITARGAAR